MASFALFFTFILLITISKCDFESKLISKRNDIDLQTCIDNFNVHKDKIIRTQDSRDMGAKYLNEIDLGSREECLRLCCETENCDVFVFEEKTTGSCYLFQCGPPENFKCKFTHHANYSSAILALNKHLPDLESQIKLTKHEKDLNQLRKAENGVEVNTKAHEIQTTPLTTSTTRIKYIFTPTKDTLEGNKSNKDRKCSRYQFECRTSKECIAIYNACDGIPQCADGSDEAPELGCPEGATTTPTTPTIINNHIFEANNPRVPIEPVRNDQTYGRIRHPQDQTASKDSDFIRPNNRNFLPIERESPPVPYPPQSQSQNSWIPHQSNYDPQQFQQYDERNNRYYNHKEGIQNPDEQVSSQPQYGNVNHDKIYFDGVYHPQDGWQPNPAENRYADKYEAEEKVRQNWPQRSRERGNENRQLHYDGEMNQNNEDYHEHEKMAHELKHSKELMQKPTKTSENEKIVTIEKPPKHLYNAEMYKLVDDDLQDGIAQTPGGAILSLTLGLVITCVMAILIGCRLRLVRRRLRRGGKSYAHDADYLVNGMYL